MPKAIELLKQGRNEELWQMCCGYLKLNIQEFMELQNNLLLQQLELFSNSPIGKKIMRGTKPKTVEEFRRLVPLTDYKDYCPELLEKREDGLPAKPKMWAHSSGWTGEYNYKWIPLSPEYFQQLSRILYGIGMISCASYWGDVSNIPNNIKLLYGVAPRPYISGTFADALRLQSPFRYLPNLEEAEKLSYEERIAAGFQQALSEGVDYFFGISLVLVKVGEKLHDSSSKVDIRQYLTRPRALRRLTWGLLKSRLARRPMLPRDIWSLKGIIGSGVDSLVYKQKIKQLWGKTPLDIYTCTEGGVIATQTWDYEGMTFIPNLNFFEFIPEDELLKWQMDRSYQMKTLLLNEVKAGECYEIVITSLHGGSLVRYRIGDMIKIISLGNEKLGINIPQMAFERRVDDLIDLYVVRLSEKVIWQAIDKTGIDYEDWIAFKDKETQTLNIYIELKNGFHKNLTDINSAIASNLALVNTKDVVQSTSKTKLAEMVDLKIDVKLLAKGSFEKYKAQRQAEGADLAHLKPPHINPSNRILAILLGESEETIVVTKTKKKPKLHQILAK